MKEMQIRSLHQEDALEKELATSSSILAWEISWKEETGRLQSMGLPRVRHDWVTEQQPVLQIRKLSPGNIKWWSMSGSRFISGCVQHQEEALESQPRGRMHYCLLVQHLLFLWGYCLPPWVKSCWNGMAVPIYIPTNSVGVFSFLLHLLFVDFSKIYLFI